MHNVLVYAIAVVTALAIPVVTRGSYRRMFAVQWRFGAVLFSGLAIQAVLEYASLPKERWHDLGVGLLIASYVLILAFVARNLVIRGMGIVFIGIACNALVITVNQGMPFKVPAAWQSKPWTQATVKHHPQQPDDKLRFLSDIIVLEKPFESVISFGDLILAVGLCDVAFNASRKLKRRGPAPARKASRSPVSIDLNEYAESQPRSEPPARRRRTTPRQDDEPTRSRRTRSRATTTRSS